ncbi:PAS domain-containing hybrid sensor histidine kinase/response regulator [Hymenobacter metallicola]|uniref:histidine kinase n=1 Tax=Hymenobacter metallicola TaxID=2563114 RepID=A0A4Z0QCE2_9BACT|nr:PAS domain-containing hybrid sensor histidine kinase/response regulator [Hymenobacter metallicola]TGE27395.1 PAS domain-containing sensor histidine kinase [Hymenobacter metallicola]
MTSIAYRQMRRRLQQAQRLQAAAQLELQALRALVEHHQAAAARQTEALLQTITTGLLIENPQGIATLNSRLSQLLQLPDPAETYIGQPSSVVFAQVPLSNPGWTRAQMQAAIDGKQQVKGMLQELTNGMILQVDYLPIVQNGATVLHLWSYEDVTQQQRTQQRVQELSRLAEQCPNPIICFTHDGRARYANSAAQAVQQALESSAEAGCHSFLRSEITAALTDGQPRVYEYSLSAVRYLWTIAPLPGEGGANVYLTDITARYEAERELEHSRLFAQRITDTIPNLVVLMDLDDNRLLYCNSQSQALLGYTDVEMVALGGRVLPVFLRAADLRSLQQRGPELAQTPDGHILEAEYQIRHRDGSWRWMKFKSTPFLRHADGRVHQMVASGEDITARRTTEAKLRQSQLFVERLASMAPNFIYIFDIEAGRNVYCNQYIEQVLGYSAADLQSMGSSLLVQLAPLDQLLVLQDHFAQIAECADGEARSLELTLYHRDGSLRWLHLNNTPFERNAAGEVKLVVGVAEDITHWKVAEEQRRAANRSLAEQNHLFRQVIDTTPHLIYLKDGEGNYLLANQATADLYGLSVGQVTQANTAKLPIAPQDAARYLRADRRVILTQQELMAEETFTRPNGEVLWFYSIKRPFMLADGTTRVLGVDSNITALKETQQALRQAKEAAEENARVKQDFLANMSHEIRTPMNGILGLAELLHKTPLDERQSQYLEHIRYSAEQLLVIIDDILVMAQLGASKVRVDTTAFDLREVLTASRQLLLPKATEKGITLELELPPAEESMLVIGDPYRLRQILLNLLSNAVKFTDQGHVLLTCRRLSAPQDAPVFQFSVLDTGIGIPPHQLEQVFESFTQATASTAREYGGSGLGLSISRGLVELLGGSIRVESRLHEGSTFYFTLPFEKVETLARTTVPPRMQPDFHSLGPRRILLAEDNSVNQFLVQAQLQGWGCQVDIASNGREALLLFQQRSYDAVLMDIQMPGIDGIATARLLREHPDPQRAATPIIALTAHAMQGEAERYYAAGLNGYVSKPFREEELFRMLAQVLNVSISVAEPVPTPPVPSEEATPLYSLSGIRRLAHDNEEFVVHLIRVFMQTTPPILAQLEQALQQQDWPTLSATAHHLKSSLTGLQINSLSETVRRLEAVPPSPGPGQLLEIQQLVQQVLRITEQVIAQLRQEFPT